MTATDLHLGYKADTANPYPEQELTNYASEEIREYVEWLEEKVMQQARIKHEFSTKIETSIEICRLALCTVEKTLKEK